ncbi:MAG: glycosyltransferase family 117 protein [Mucilaginibacter sp.]
MQYKKINNLLGWLCFAIATTTYIFTLERSVSFWDCGEFIACAARLQVSHQPGYPLFAMLGKAFSLLSFGDKSKIAYFMNFGSALASGATIMFLFWTITALARKLFQSNNETLDQWRTGLVMSAGLVGALAFTYTDTFWFSAVEYIVFAWSALCTAIVFWAILKWDAHADEPGADRWIVFIAYMIGLSIGIHLLNLLTIPALVLVYYFRRYKKINLKTGAVAFLISIVILAFVQYGIRGYTVAAAAYSDLFFVNKLGLGFGSGVIAFAVLLAGGLIYGVWYSIKHKKPMLNLAFLCVIFIYLGYSSFIYIPIRATAGTNLNNSHPDNAFTLYGYLNRVQYGSTPLLSGQYYDAKITDEKDGSMMYRKGEKRYEPIGKQVNYVYDHTTLFPRMYLAEGDPDHAQATRFYEQWLNIPDGQAPTFADNMKFLFSWQLYQMYWRYFMWNFAGRYSDDDMAGQTDMNGIGGNWTTGLFDGSKHLPKSVTNSVTYTPLYALPLVLGLLGLFYHIKRSKRDALIVGMLFFFTGIAIVLYVNQPNIQPRERDYSYVGSFYAFAIWIGFGVMALVDLARKKIHIRYALAGSTLLCLLIGPVLLASREWGDHDRSTKLTAHDMAYDYLISCPKNAILFDYGDNDTYSLWAVQEAEHIRPDVRIVNMSLFGMDWSIRQMQHKINDADALPISMPFSKYQSGTRDYIPYNDSKIPGYAEVSDVFEFITSDDQRTQLQYNNGTYTNYLPTRNLKLTVNAGEVVANHVISPAQQNQLADTVKWQLPADGLTKEKLAMMDILNHNHWKRPICFATSVGSANMFGLQQYLYQEGFTCRLMPLKPDTSANNGQIPTNSLVMYNNMMNKFKWGKFKTAKYLDQQSTQVFYPQIVQAFADLAVGLVKSGHADLAKHAIHKYDAVMPDINPNLMAAQGKISLADTSYKLNDDQMGNKLVASVDNYLTDQLDYNYYLLQNNAAEVDPEMVQYGIRFLNGMAAITKEGKQPELSNKLIAQVTDYENKFGMMLRR